MRRAALLLAAVLAASSSTSRAQPLPEGECAGVYWDLTARFASGDRLYARVLVTRAGPGERSAAGLGHWIEPDGHVTPFQNGRLDDGFESDAAGRRLRIGSTELELTGDSVRFAVDNDKRGVKLAVSLEAPADPAPLPLFEGDPAIEVLSLGRPIEGRFWRQGLAAARTVRGFASLVRTRHRACERDLTALRVDVHLLAFEGSALLVHQRRPDHSAESWLGWRDGDGRSHAIHPRDVELESWRLASGDDSSRLPRRLRLKDPVVSGTIEIDAAHLSIDPLDALPRLMRMLYWFGARPRRLWADGTFELTAEALPRGAAIATFTFLRPQDDLSRNPDPGG